jgi:hypothetical protein
VLNTLICDIDDGKFDLSNPDDLDDLECQIASGLDNPEVADMAEMLMIEISHGHVSLYQVRERVDEMLGILLLQEEMKEEETGRWLDENLVPTG